MNSSKKESFRYTLLGSGVVLAAIAYATLHGIPEPARITASVFALVIFYWITEVIPLFVTAILGSVLLQLLLGPLARLFGFTPFDYKQFITPFASPVVVLMFGGFFMARVFSLYNLDIQFSNYFLRRIGNRPKAVLFGVMVLTASLSMWMSNTATTAIMVAAMLPLASSQPKGSNFSKAIMLGIPFAANIGGIGTPIGTTPNAIAIGILADMGRNISFLEWMIAGVPALVIMLLIVWLLLVLVFPLKGESFELTLKEAPKASKHWLIYGTFAITVILWMTDVFHGISSAIIAMLPVIVFSIAGIAGKRVLRDCSWEILLLIGGGLSLGVGIRVSGLGEIIVSALHLNELGTIYAAYAVAIITAGMATFMSHTASSNLVLPLAATIGGAASSPLLVISAAICASYGMALPISTPPNAIAYGSELIETRDMFKTGIIVTIIGVGITVIYEYYLFVIMGL